MAKFLRPVNEMEEQNADVKEESEAADKALPLQPASTAQSGARSDVSVISASLKVTGNLESAAEIRLEGEVEGDVRGNVVTIGDGANITGSVYGETVNISGTINGKVEGRNVVVSKTARSTGDIIHERLQIEAGAYVDGHCRPEFGKSQSSSARLKTADQPSKPEVTGSDKAA